NEVHYGIHLDSACGVVGDRPVYAYWRMFEERGGIEPILGIEKPAYGLDDDQIIRRSGGVTTVRVELRAFRDRPVTITVAPSDKGCVATASTVVAGTDSHLRSIYVKVRWPFGVDYVLLRGTTQDGRRVEERLQN